MVRLIGENNSLLGVCGLGCDGTWYYLDDERSDIPLYRMQMELRFRLGDERTKVIAARDSDKIVSSVTVWYINDDRAATENIFTIPEYRRKKIGMATVAKSLSYLKKNGYKMATLTCVGDNLDAIALYNKIGYRVMGHLLEMHWVL